ncbi:MAG: DUF1554 domain-containing protein [Myxococcota bacterium]
MFYRSLVVMALFAVSASGCFAPNELSDDDEETTGESSTEASTTTVADASGTTSTAAGSTSSQDSTGGGDAGSEEESGVVTLSSSSGQRDDSETTATPPPGCGDGTVDEGEECDEGDANGGSDCTEVCSLPFCGDGIVSEPEMCDDADDNGTDLGVCAPDCSKVVDAKTITLSYNYGTNGDMGADAIAHVDARCESAGLGGYKAMFANGTSRRATVTPYVGDGQMDWVLTPWTRYLRDDGELIWVTDESALLGVRDGNPEPLLQPIATQLVTTVYTGLRGNWLAELNDDCVNWSTNSSGASHYAGQPDELTSALFLAGTTPAISPGNCGSTTPVYCVQQ